MGARYPYHGKTAAHLGGYQHSMSDSFAAGQGGFADNGLAPRRDQSVFGRTARDRPIGLGDTPQ